ncbi:MAG: prepilin peptidase [Acidimicrobiia bacterium]|nr:prepilin peptidase [Acidimicrobiia bacterium]
MPYLIVAGVVVGLILARSIVAEADAHRAGLDDRWWGPRCGACGAALGPTLASCKTGHRQRWLNVAILVATPLLLAIAAIVVPSPWVWPAYATFSASLVLLTVTDLDTKLIPNRILGPATLATAILLIVGWSIDRDSGSVLRAAGGAVAYFAVMYLLALLARGGLGFGDVKLAFLIGLMAGFGSWGAVVLAGVAAFVVGGIVSVVLLATRRFGRKDAIPFGPFLMVGGIIAVFWGSEVVSWYLR